MGEKDERIRREDNKFRKGIRGTESRKKEKREKERDWGMIQESRRDSLASSRIDRRSVSRASSWRS